MLSIILESKTVQILYNLDVRNENRKEIKLEQNESELFDDPLNSRITRIKCLLIYFDDSVIQKYNKRELGGLEQIYGHNDVFAKIEEESSNYSLENVKVESCLENRFL